MRVLAKSQDYSRYIGDCGARSIPGNVSDCMHLQDFLRCDELIKQKCSNITAESMVINVASSISGRDPPLLWLGLKWATFLKNQNRLFRL